MLCYLVDVYRYLRLIWCVCH